MNVELSDPEREYPRIVREALASLEMREPAPRSRAIDIDARQMSADELARHLDAAAAQIPAPSQINVTMAAQPPITVVVRPGLLRKDPRT